MAEMVPSSLATTQANISKDSTTQPAIDEGKKKRDKGAFKFKHFTIRHDLCGMKVGTDAVLLTGYASLDNRKPNSEVWEGKVEFKENEHLSNEDTHSPEPGPRRILEIGCGSGVITLLLTHRYKNAIVDSIDIDDGAIKQALFNIEHCPIPSVQERIRLFHCPAQEFTSPPLDPSLPNTNATKNTTTNESNTESGNTESDDTEEETRDKQKNLNTFFKYSPAFDSEDYSNGIYDLIICAPPYFKSDESTDMILRMKNKRRIARHTHTLLMEELASVVRTMLKKDSGQFKTIFSLPYPADVFQKAAPATGLQCVEKVHIKDNPSDNPVRLMETYITPHSLTPQHTITTTQSTHDDESTRESTKEKSTSDKLQDESMRDESHPEATNNTSPPPIERQFSIYTASYKEMPVMHRPYTNQYKFLVKDFCIHFLNK
eukprot:Phypoly_transcript_10085.p1 GENE.Phypoly_transcript_10085~~Phypoly_transcript_10085.p1  ORF type:complete len:447 (+),score=83.41 Phypoly_transcript_10085:51-1343(+)